MSQELISYHGGHSGQYCNHAEDLLEEIVLKYIERGFKAVGITEHIPPVNDQFLYPDERALDLSATDLAKRFESYFSEVFSLKKKYAGQITIYAGMETETVTGYVNHVKQLIETFRPDYIVGSVHHIDDRCFDYSRSEYDGIAESLGGYDLMYQRYFDLQYEMIQELTPFVVGHFDLIRIYDDAYEERLTQPAIDEKINRNLALIKSLDLVMDFNLRPLTRDEKEPYITGSILKKAKRLGICLVPGDDSHGVAEAGNHVSAATQMLSRNGFSTQWPAPKMLTKGLKR